MNHIKLLPRNRITSKFIHNYEKNKCNNVIKRNNDFMKEKLNNILSSHTKEYLKLEQEMKNEFDLQRTLGHQRGVIKRWQIKTGIFWGLYTGVLFSGVALGCYVFDK